MHPSLKSKVYLILIHFCFLNIGWSQHPNQKILSVEQDGLLSNDNYRTIQDKNGYIWITSKNGIVKYDGIRSKHFTTNEGLPTNDVWYIKCDSKNRIWLYTFKKGVYYIENDKVKSIKNYRNEVNIYFTGEYNDSLFFLQYDVYTLSKAQRFYLDNKNNKLKVLLNGNNNVKHFELYKNKYFSLIQNREIPPTQYIIKSLNTRKIKQNIGNDISEIYEDNTEAIYYREQINPLKQGQWVILKDNKRVTCNMDDYLGCKVKKIRKIDSGGFLVQTDSEVRVYSSILTKSRDIESEKKLKTFMNTQPPIVNFHLFIDREGNFWITYERGRIHFLPYYASSHFNFAIPTGSVITFLLEVEGFILVQYSYNRQAITYILKSSTSKAIMLDEYFLNSDLQQWNGQLLALNSGNKIELFSKDLIRSKSWDLYDQNTIGINGVNLKFLFINDSTFIDGLGNYFLFNEKKLVRLNKHIDLNGNRVQHMIKIRGGLMWSNENGLYTFNNQHHFLGNYNVNKLDEYLHLSLIGTNGNGLLIYDQKKKKIVGKVLNNLIINDFCIKDGVVFCATNNGLYTFQIRQTKKGVTIKNLQYFCEFNGITAREINKVIVCNNQIVLTTIFGIDRIPLSQLRHKKTSPPTIYLSTIESNTKQIQSINKKIFQPNQNNVRLQFDCISFSDIGYSKFNIKVSSKNGYKGTYEPADGVLQLTNLIPGEYRVYATVTNQNGISSNPIRFSFTVEKWFYQMWWFSGVLILLFVLVLIWLYRFFVNRRVGKAEEKNQKTALQLQTLRSQLNPHFIFNALNSIQYAIFLKGEREANEYINTFSRLIRSALYNSHNDYISLEDEMTFLETYLKLEKWRMDGELEYEVEVAPNLDPKKIKMINMTLQPIVENAIIHGLFPKEKGLKKISISFDYHAHVLTCIIQDNGIGRVASTIRKNNSDQYYKSLSSTILKERIKIMESTKKMFIYYEIEDLYNSQNDPLGTRVTLKINTAHEN